MNPLDPCVLSLNGGSSSIKFALYHAGETLQRLLGGQIDRIGQGYARLSFEHVAEPRSGNLDVAAADHRSAVASLMDWLASPDGMGGEDAMGTIDAIGHRIVHGMSHVEPEAITEALLAELRRIQPYDPEHLPGEIALIEAFRLRLPAMPQLYRIKIESSPNNLFAQGGNSLRDLSWLERYPSIGSLDLLGNSISDLSVLPSLRNLRFLNLSYNLIEDARPLADLATTNAYVSLSENPVQPELCPVDRGPASLQSFCRSL